MENTTDTALVSAGLKIPAPRQNYILRSSLFEKLAQCEQLSVVYICSGAGTGKTTLLSTFIREKKLQGVGWISLDIGDTGIYTFWLHVARALAPVLNDNSLVSIVKANPDITKIEQMLLLLADRISGSSSRYLVLDDVQYIADRALIRSLDFFLSIMPSNLHIFMLSRSKPPVYLGRLAVSGRLLFIGAEDLVLSGAESMTFLRTTLHLNKSDGELEKLAAYAEGWIGGLQLAAAAETAGKKTMYGDSGIAADYLNQEIFATLSSAEQDFLVCTGPLAYFDADICSRLIERCTPETFRSVIMSLTARNLFIVCLDEQNGIYRYHNILSDFLIRQFELLPVSRQTLLLTTAARLFEQRGDISEALRLLNRAGDFGAVMHVAQHTDDNPEIWCFLDSIPIPMLVGNPDLALKNLLYNIGTLNVDRVKVLYTAFKEKYHDTPLDIVANFATMYLAAGNIILPEEQVLTAEQVEQLPFGSTLKAIIYILNADTLTSRLKYEEADRCIDRAQKLGSENNVFVSLFVLGQKAQLYEETGRLNESLFCYHAAVHLLDVVPAVSGVWINFLIGMTGVYFRRMELEQAQVVFDRAESMYESIRSRIGIMDVTIQYHRAELEFLKGNAVRGKKIVMEILARYPTLNMLNLDRLVMELDCAGLLDQELASQFMHQLAASPDIYQGMLFMRLLKARILARQGNTEAAVAEVDAVLALSRSHRNRLRLVEADLFQIRLLALCIGPAEKIQKKRELLRESLYYAWENRILMPYYLERETVLPLLRGLESESDDVTGFSSSEKKFLKTVIAVCSGTVSGTDMHSLSVREVEVLRELARGITNREIADRLCISLATVKTHVLNIFSKLGVSSRMQAVEEARKNNLL